MCSWCLMTKANVLMMILFFFFFFSPTFAVVDVVDVIGSGSPAYLPFLQQAAMSYQLINPQFNFSFIPTYTTSEGFEKMVHDPSSRVSIILSEGQKPNASQNPEDFQMFPFVALGAVVQINFPFDIILNRSVIADIYRANVTWWNDTKITSTNPGLPIPNAPITVFWRNDNIPYNGLWSQLMSAFSPEWKNTIGITSYWPTNYTNWYVTSSNPSQNGAIAYTKNSLGFINHFMVSRDPAYHYIRVFHQDGYPLECNGSSLEAATQSIVLAPDLYGKGTVDSKAYGAWVHGTLGYLLVSKNPKDCKVARHLYRFLRWLITSTESRDAIGLRGGGPLNANLTQVVMSHLSKIQCNGKSVGAYENLWNFESLDAFFLTLTILVLVVGLVLSSIHIYYFSFSKINVIYSIVFVFGTTLTLLSPIFWFFPPEQGSICLTRLWTGSLGFTILLGTMFSRTWQLNDIYQLQKYKMDTLRFQTTTSKTLTQLAITLSGVIFTNILLLTLWSAIDPLSPSFVVVDEEALTGYYTCTSGHMETWATLELLFFLFLLIFGIYVIYNTWSFQRQTLLVETRWVLLALYNVVLNIFAVLPILVLSDIDEKILSLIVVASIDLSGASIICAVLLPRLLQKLDKSSKSEGTTTGESVRGPANVGSKKQKEHKEKEMSRTPEDELAKRLEEPLPLTNRGNELELASFPGSNSPSSPLSRSRDTIAESTHFVHSALNREPIAEVSEGGEASPDSPELAPRKKSSPEATPSKPRQPEVSQSGIESEAELLHGMDETSGGERMYMYVT